MIRKINLMSHTKKGNVHDVAFSVIVFRLVRDVVANH